MFISKKKLQLIEERLDTIELLLGVWGQGKMSRLDEFTDYKELRELVYTLVAADPNHKHVPIGRAFDMHCKFCGVLLKYCAGEKKDNG